MYLLDRLKSAGRRQTIFWTRVPRCIEEGDIRLRFPGREDGPLLAGGLEDAGLLPQGYLTGRGLLSWVYLRWWIRKTFILSYIIEVGSRPIGVAGVCDIQPGESAEITVLIFKKGDRRRGYGGRTVAICTEALKRSFSIKRMVAEVESKNIASLSFLKKTGFGEIAGGPGINIFSKEV